MKKILKFVLIFILSCFGGMSIGAGIGGLISGKTFAEIIGSLFSMSAIETIGVALFAIFALAVCVVLHLIIHEAGHLIFGLWSGYKFLSFRIFNLTFYRREDGKIGMKKYAIENTGGQCLMLPPEVPAEQIPVVAYNLGGVIMNFILIIPFGIGLFFCKGHPLLAMFCLMGVFAGLFLIITNGIPMCVGGFPNDGYNAMKLCKNDVSRKAFASILKVNALSQNGLRPRDVPEESLMKPDEVDFNEPLQVNCLMFYAAVLMDRGEWDESLAINKLIMENASKIGIMLFEAKCEAACLLLMSGEVEEAKSLLTEKELKRVKAYRRSMSSKQRLLFFLALKADGDRQKAQQIYDQTLAERDTYLIRGEVEMDLDIMSKFL